MNKIVAGTWVEFLKDYQGAKAQDQCKVLCNIQGGLYVTNQRGGQIYSLEFLKSHGIIEIMSDYNTDVSTLAWQHNRSALVHLMLLDGYKYIMCEVAEEDKDFGWMDSLDIYIITGVEEDKSGNYYFVDIEGEFHTAAQPIKGNGDIMSYSDYIKLKQL